MENELILKLKQSDENAYEVIFRLYYHPLKLFASNILSDIELAEDIVQEVFVQLWETRQSIKDISLKSYLYKIVRNKSLNQIRHLQVRQKHEDEILHTTNEFVEEGPQNDELKAKILTSIGKLPEQCKKIFIMSRINNMKHKEIAEELNISVKTVKNQVGKALKVLREELKGVDIALIITLMKFF